MCPSGARKAAYDEATPMCRPKQPRPETTPLMASSQMPPIASVRAPGLVAAFQKPPGKPSTIRLALVEPSRSAAVTNSAPPLACVEVLQRAAQLRRAAW